MSRPWRFAREVKNRAGEGATLNNLGEVYRALSQYERAIGYYEQALAIAREVKRPGRGRRHPEQPG